MVSLAGAVSVFNIGRSIGSALFGKKKKTPKAPTPRENILSQARGVREAADKYGFNPLTLLEHGQPGGSMASAPGPAPLSSIDVITNSLSGLDDVLSGEREAERQRKREELELDLMRIEVDQARSGVIASAPLGRQAVSAPSGGATFSEPFSMRPTRVTGAAGRSSVGGPSRAPNPIAPGRDKEIDPLINSSGVFEIDNAMTGGPIVMPGEGEPWGIDEVATGLIVGMPQVLGRAGGRALDRAMPGWNRRKPYHMTEEEWREFKKKKPDQRPAPFMQHSIPPSPFGLPHRWY